MVYDKARFLRMVANDVFLKFTWKTRKQSLPPEQHNRYLEAMFNTYVRENSVAMREYLKNHAPNSESGDA